MITILDHLAVLAFAVGLPIYAWLRYPKFQQEVASGKPDVRSRQYMKTILRQWLLTAAVLAIWARASRPWSDLGFTVSFGPGFLVALLLAVAIVQFWRTQIGAALLDEAARERLLEQLRTVAPILPSSERELRLFTLLSVTAGICEEIWFRGYLIWYLSAYVTLPVATFSSAVLFGMGHIYQGARQALRIILVGALFALFYVGTGSLLIPVALHVLLDAAQGRLAYRLLRTA